MAEPRTQNDVESVAPEQSERRHHQRSSKTVVPTQSQEYAERVSQFSVLTAANSLFPGLHLEGLAKYLQQPYDGANAPDLPPAQANNVGGREFEFVSLHDLNPKARTSKHFNSIEEFESYATPLLTQTEHGQLLFMRGNPSPEWLLSIGTTYGVDPEFLHRHLDFKDGNANYFVFPSLLSTTSNTARLRITTIGSTMMELGNNFKTQELVEDMRERNETLLTTHHGKLQDDRGGLALGESIVRQCSIYDTRHFTIEQDVSIWTNTTEKSWIAIIWLDIGRDLGGEETSWLARLSYAASQQWLTRLLPTIQLKPNAAFKPRSHRRSVEPSSSCQSAALLHLDYGRDQDQCISACDAFYALNEIFKFTAFSESQFLNLLDLKLAEQLSQRSILENKNMTLSNVFYYRSTLERHMQRMTENIASIKVHSLVGWPKQNLDEPQRLMVDAAAAALLKDYEDLLRRMQDLHKQCNKGMQIMMSNASIRESQKAILQAAEVTKLTRLAFIFVPLSFLTSFFGMNFEQLGTGTQSIWIFFVAAFPLVVSALFFMQFDARERLLQLGASTNLFFGRTIESDKGARSARSTV